MRKEEEIRPTNSRKAQAISGKGGGSKILHFFLTQSRSVAKTLKVELVVQSI